MPFPHEEHREIGSFWSWMIVILFCVVIVVWGVLNYLWDMGVLRDVPGQSIYSTAVAPVGPATPKQVAPLPDGRPAE